MGDLYRGLMRRELRKGQNGEEFWGKFNSLDNVSLPAKSFLEIQIEKLSALEENAEYNAVNSFLRESIYHLSETEQIENEIGEQVYSKIIALMNSGLRGSEYNPYKQIKTSGLTEEQVRENAKKSGEIEKILKELERLLTEANVEEGLNKSIVKMLNNFLGKKFSWNDFSHEYIIDKANQVEELMADRINQDPNLRAIVTGAWTDKFGQQLIEDVFAFSKAELDIPFSEGILTCTFSSEKGKGQIEAKSIGDFLDQISKTGAIKITVPDELYDALRKAAVITGQAKSGLKDQAILNKNKRNSLSLEQVNFDPMLLWELYQEDLKTRTNFFKESGKQNSETLEALTNYCLSKEIAKTALSLNKLYLTSDGFVTASQWMKKHSRYLIFTPAIRSVDGEFLTKQRPYYFT